jgi:hypothetical protein
MDAGVPVVLLGDSGNGTGTGTGNITCSSASASRHANKAARAVSGPRGFASRSRRVDRVDIDA